MMVQRAITRGRKRKKPAPKKPPVKKPSRAKPKRRKKMARDDDHNHKGTSNPKPGQAKPETPKPKSSPGAGGDDPMATPANDPSTNPPAEESDK
jgi:hypothetical protein